MTVAIRLVDAANPMLRVHAWRWRASSHFGFHLRLVDVIAHHHHCGIASKFWPDGGRGLVWLRASF